MGDITQHRPVLLICAVISRHDDALDWAEEKLTSKYGSVLIASERFAWYDTTFYQKSMGADLKKQFLAFEQLIDPASLPSVKLATNEWESQYAAGHEHAEDRPLNLDPGYITEAKLVLATTKDRDHRLYLSDGIFGEVTLHYHKGNWCKRPWTYPDYQREDFQRFFTDCRNQLRTSYRLES